MTSKRQNLLIWRGEKPANFRYLDERPKPRKEPIHYLVLHGPRYLNENTEPLENMHFAIIQPSSDRPPYVESFAPVYTVTKHTGQPKINAESLAVFISDYSETMQDLTARLVAVLSIAHHVPLDNCLLHNDLGGSGHGCPRSCLPSFEFRERVDHYRKTPGLLFGLGDDLIHEWWKKKP